MVVGDDHQCRSLLRLNRIEWMQTRGAEDRIMGDIT